MTGKRSLELTDAEAGLIELLREAQADPHNIVDRFDCTITKERDRWSISYQAGCSGSLDEYGLHPRVTKASGCATFDQAWARAHSRLRLVSVS